MEKRGEFFDYDPLTGIEERYEEADGKIHIHSYQDVAPVLEYTKELRNTGTSDEAWRKHGVAKYAEVPMIVVGQMIKKGIRFFDQNHIGAVVREINQNYPHCKTTDKHHQVKV